MVKPRRIGHATLDTHDLERAIAYYEEFIGLKLVGRERDRAFLATRIGQLAIELNKASHPRCTKLSFEVAPHSDFAGLAKQLAKDGIKSDLHSDSAPGAGQLLTFADDKGTSIQLFKDWSYLGKHGQGDGVGPLKLGHVAFYTSDIQRTVAFYEKVLSFRVSDWIGDFFCFMRCNTDHHTVNFYADPVSRLHHFAFEVRDTAHIMSACDLMGQKKVPIIWGPLRQGAGHNVAIYHRNPDDQVVEFYCELDQMLDEELGYFVPRPWHHDTPQRPKRWAPGRISMWGPTPEDAFDPTKSLTAAPAVAAAS